MTDQTNNPTPTIPATVQAIREVNTGISAGADKVGAGLTGAARELNQGVGQGLASIANAVTGVANSAGGAASEIAKAVTKPSVLFAGTASWMAWVFSGVILAAVLVWPLKAVILEGMAIYERQMPEIRKQEKEILEKQHELRRLELERRSAADKAAADARERKEAERKMTSGDLANAIISGQKLTEWSYTPHKEATTPNKGLPSACGSLYFHSAHSDNSWYIVCQRAEAEGWPPSKVSSMLSQMRQGYTAAAAYENHARSNLWGH